MAASPVSSPREILTVERLFRKCSCVGKDMVNVGIRRRFQREVFLCGSVYMSLELSPVVTAIIRQLMTRRFEMIESNSINI
jgi:hypothetical protein